MKKYCCMMTLFLLISLPWAAMAAGPGDVGGDGGGSDPDNPVPGNPACLPATFTINEYFDLQSNTGRFLASMHSTPCDERYLVGFAVGNKTAFDVSTKREFWEASIVSEEEWEDGVPWGPFLGQTTADLPFTFEQFFGTDATQALYYHAAPTGFALPAAVRWIGLNAFDDRFFFESLGPDSKYVAFDQRNGILAVGETTIVPEPATSFLLLMGVVGLGMARRRSRAARVT